VKIRHRPGRQRRAARPLVRAGGPDVVYALNIADRFSISTLIEPIRQELRLSTAASLPHGVALARST